MLEFIRTICCWGHKTKIFIKNTCNIGTQTDTILEVDNVYSSDFESSTSPIPSPKRMRSPLPFLDDKILKKN